MSDIHDQDPAPELPARVSALLGRPETWAVPPAALEDDVLAAFRRERDATPDQTGRTVVALAPTELAPGASGRAEIRDTPSGFAVELDLEGLPPAPRGSYYQAWFKNTDGDLVTIGTFHGRDRTDDIVLWSAVDPRDYPTITVTVQREGDGPASSGQVVLRGTAGEAAEPTPRP